MKLQSISTVGMSREDWLRIRKNAIGGSDAAALLGLNAYSSPYAVWADKLGLLQEQPPPVDSSSSCTDALSQVYACSDSEISRDLSGISDIVNLYQKTEAQIKELQKISDGYKNQIKAFMQEAESGYTEKFRISWKTQSRSSLDSKALQNAEPELYQKYLKTSASRVFRCKEIKE